MEEKPPEVVEDEKNDGEAARWLCCQVCTLSAQDIAGRLARNAQTPAPGIPGCHPIL